MTMINVYLYFDRQFGSNDLDDFFVSPNYAMMSKKVNFFLKNLDPIFSMKKNTENIISLGIKKCKNSHHNSIVN